MKAIPIGTVGETKFVVEERHAIEFAQDGMPAVLSTPNLIGIMERTARQAIATYLAADERSVGVEIELRHLAATPLGATVTVTAKVIRAEDRRVEFQLAARDDHELIARGVHQRAVIRVGSFAERLRRKFR